jgi:NAD(P)-dependent dehydrogenase (short-subunit alcohol dehydrogenase family)
MDEFAGKVALVTGAGRGAGQEVAVALASLGVAIAANDINPLNLDATINRIVQVGGKARSYVFDVAKRMPIQGMLAQVLADFNRIDILVSHASVRPDAALLEMDEWEFHRTIDVNLAGPYFCMQQVGRVMREQGGGSIVNLISSGYNNFHKGQSAHMASQVALVGLTRVAASELSAYHIRVNAVYYGPKLNEVISATELDSNRLRDWLALLPPITLGDHPDLVTRVLYLCSSQSASMNGLIIAANID